MTIAIVQSKAAAGTFPFVVTLDAAPTPGNTLLALIAAENEEQGTISPGEWLDAAGSIWTPINLTISIYAHNVIADDPVEWTVNNTEAVPGRACLVEVSGIYRLVDDEGPDNGSGETFSVGLTPTVGMSALVIAGTIYEPDTATASPGSGITALDDGTLSAERRFWTGYQIIEQTIGTCDIGGTADGGTGWWEDAAVFTEPLPGGFLDVYQVNPPGTSITFLATLDDATDKSIRIERNGTGSGQFTLNRHSEHATAAILAPGNLVKVRIPEIDPDPIFAFFLETGDFTLVSTEEEGGENITFGGRGALAYWDNAVWLTLSYVINWWKEEWGTPPAGTLGRLIVNAGTYWHYTISGGKITSRAQYTTGGHSAWYDKRKAYKWATGTAYEGRKQTLVQLSSGAYDNYYLHPMDHGMHDTRARALIGQKAEFGEIGDGTKPGQILKRIYDEVVSADRPSHPLPLLTIDFDDTLDSADDPWASTDALLGITADLGEHYLSTIAKLIETGILDVEMDPDLGFHAYNSLGRDLTGNAFDVGVVRFVRGVNIAGELRRERTDGPIATFTQVVGNDASAQAELPDAASRVTRETSTQADGDDATALAALGLADLEARLVRSDAIGFAIATGNDEEAGLYLPGPPGSEHGKFWIGDSVTLHTGTGEQDFNNTTERVAAITISEDEAANLDVVVELGSGLGANERPSPETSGGGWSGGGGGGTLDGSLYQEIAERGAADGYATLDGDALVPIVELPVGTGAAEVAAGDHVHALDDLSDVDTTGKADGDTILWNVGAGLWEPGASGGGGSPNLDGGRPDSTYGGIAMIDGGGP